MKELIVIVIYAQIASGHILLTVRSCASVAIKVEKAPPFFFTCSMMMLWRISGVNFVHFGAGKSVLKHNFFDFDLKRSKHFEVTSHLWLICPWLSNSEHFGACCNLLSASEQKIWPFNWRKVRKKSWPMITSKSDPRGHTGLKLCVHVLVMGYYRLIDFHQNRTGSGDFLGRLHAEYPLFGVESPIFGIVHSILTDQSFNLDVGALVGKVHTISAKQKTILTDSIQFRKCIIGLCKMFPSPRLPSLGRLLSRLPCDSPWVFPDRPNFHVRRTCGPVSNQRRFPNSGGQWQVGPAAACVAFDW